MSKKLAEQAFQINERKQIRDLLTRQKAEIDDAFFAHLLEVSNRNKEEQKYDEAIFALLIVFDAGEIAVNVYFRACSLLQAAYVEIAKRDFDKCLTRIHRCIAECDKASDPRCVELKAEAHHLLGQLQDQQYGQVNEALQSLQTALDLYRKLQKQDAAERIQQYIDQIRHQPVIQAHAKPLGDVLDEIDRSRDLLAELQDELSAMQLQHEKAKNLLARQQSLVEENSILETKITEFQQQVDYLQSRAELLSTAQNVPLWAAAVRAEVDDGEITNLTLPLLERLRTSSPQYAVPLIAEIRARNRIAEGSFFDVSQLAGDQRLFAGIANSINLELTDPFAAIEALLDAWETYLSNPVGNVQ